MVAAGSTEYMGQRRWFILAIFVCLFTFSCGRELKVEHKHVDNHATAYNHTLATILVEYASAVYMSDLTQLFTWTCPRCSGLTAGFEIIELLVDVEHCLQSFVGVSKDLNAVVIAFRGTQEHRGGCSQLLPASCVVNRAMNTPKDTKHKC